jgi:transcriptional regulator with XRE-family HTH domain
VTAKINTLRIRLTELGITVEELAELIHFDTATVLSWIEGKTEPNDSERVLLRFLASDAGAMRRVERLRRTYTTTLEGERHDGVTVPYGTNDVGKVSS